MKKNVLIFLIAIFSFLTHQQSYATDPFVENIVAQIDYLESHNKSSNGADAWYIYFPNKNISFLKKVVIPEYENIYFEEGNTKQFAALHYLNEELVRINKDEDACVYVAFTFLSNEIITPIIPEEERTVQDKIAYIKNLIKDKKSTGVNLDVSLAGLTKYKNDFNNKIDQIYSASKLKSSKASNIFMPFTCAHKITSFDKNTGSKTEQNYITYRIANYSSGAFNRAFYKSLYEKVEENDFYLGYAHVGKVYKQVLALELYLQSDVPVEVKTETLDDCSELLNLKTHKPYLDSKLFGPIVRDNPCLLKDMIPIGDAVEKTKWMEDTEFIICSALAAPMSIAAVGTVGPTLIPVIVEYATAERLTNMGVAVASTLIIEGVLIHYWTGTKAQKNSFSESLLAVNKVDLIYEGSKGALEAPLGVELIADCLYEGASINTILDDPEKLSEFQQKWSTKACVQSIGMNLLAEVGLNQAGNAFSTLKKIVKENPSLFVKGWRRVLKEVGQGQKETFVKLYKDILDKAGVSNKADLISDIEKEILEDSTGQVAETTGEQVVEEAVEEITEETAESVAETTGEEVVEEGTEEVVETIATKIDNLKSKLGSKADEIDWDKFAEDFTDVNSLQKMIDDIDLVDSWKYLKENLGSKASKQKSLQFLELVNIHLKDTEFLEIIGEGNSLTGKTNFADLIKNYVGKCDNCLDDTASTFLPDNPTEFFDKVVSLTKRYKDKGGIEIFKEAKQGINKQEGIWHAMQHLDGIEPSLVKQLDTKFSNKSICENCRFDVELLSSEDNPLKFIEYKALASPSSINLNQFKAYLSNINSLSELNYIFSKNKLGGKTDTALVTAKQGVKNFLKKNIDDLFMDVDYGGLGTEKMSQLFGVSNSVEFKVLMNTFDLTFVKIN